MRLRVRSGCAENIEDLLAVDRMARGEAMRGSSNGFLEQRKNRYLFSTDTALWMLKRASLRSSRLLLLQPLDDVGLAVQE